MASPFDAKYNAIRDRVIFYADKYGIDRNIAVWQIWYESSFNPKACSQANACGIAQFIPATAARFGVNRNDIESSLNGYGKYMSVLLRMFNNRYDIALAGYNSGENRNEYKSAAANNRAINWSIMPRGVQSETQSYVKKIMAAAGKSAPITKTVSSQLVGTVDIPDLSLNGLDTETKYILYGGVGLLFVLLITR